MAAINGYIRRKCTVALSNERHNKEFQEFVNVPFMTKANRYIHVVIFVLSLTYPLRYSTIAGVVISHVPWRLSVVWIDDGYPI